MNNTKMLLATCLAVTFVPSYADSSLPTPPFQGMQLVQRNCTQDDIIVTNSSDPQTVSTTTCTWKDTLREPNGTDMQFTLHFAEDVTDAFADCTFYPAPAPVGGAMSAIEKLGVAKSARTSRTYFFVASPSDLGKENYKIDGNHIMANVHNYKGIKDKNGNYYQGNLVFYSIKNDENDFNDGDKIICNVSPGKHILP